MPNLLPMVATAVVGFLAYMAFGWALARYQPDVLPGGSLGRWAAMFPIIVIVVIVVRWALDVMGG